jgi:hypothetical protein
MIKNGTDIFEGIADISGRGLKAVICCLAPRNTIVRQGQV